MVEFPETLLWNFTHLDYNIHCYVKKKKNKKQQQQQNFKIYLKENVNNHQSRTSTLA